MKKVHDTAGWEWVGVPVGMSADVAGLLNGVAAAGDDDTARLVAADALEESGRGEFAAFVRRQVNDGLNTERVGGNATFRGVPMTTPTYWKLLSGSDVVPRVTQDLLLSVGPWETAHWRRLHDRKITVVELASSAYRDKSGRGLLYPRVNWYRGFMSAVKYVSAAALFKFAESGAHAWHPWEPVAETDIEQAGWYWQDQWTGFRVNCDTVYDPTGWGRPGAGGGRFGHHFLSVARRLTERTRAVWHIAGRWHSGLQVRNLSVVPEPLARFVALCGGSCAPNSKLMHRIYFPTQTAAEAALNTAARLFLNAAAHQSRCRVIERGGT